MANVQSAPQRDLLRLRKERVHSTMLVEVLALLIFMSMTFAFVLRDDALRTNPWKQKYDKVVVQLRQAEKQNAILSRQVSELERANRQLLRSLSGTVAANDSITMDRDQWRELVEKLANAEAVVEAQQADNARLRDRLSGRGGTDLPNCTVSPTPFIVSIELYENGVRVSPKWPSSASASVRKVPGLTALATGQVVSMAEFRRLSAQIKDWGRTQTTPCNFRAVAYPKHASMETYRAQQNALNGAFYTAYR